ncbi:hypothetical protein ACLKA7_008348 [Drosophila subpalustris]
MPTYSRARELSQQIRAAFAFALATKSSPASSIQYVVAVASIAPYCYAKIYPYPKPNPPIRPLSSNAPMSALGDAAPEIRGGSIASKEQFVGIEEKLPLRLRVHHVAAAFAASAGTASIAQPPDTKSKSIDNFHS